MGGVLWRTLQKERKEETVSVTLLEARSLPFKLLVWLGHLHREAAWLFLGSRLESRICYIPTKGMCLSGTDFYVKL